MIRDRKEPPLLHIDAPHKYKVNEVMPSWILKSKDWKLTKGDSDGADISQILKILEITLKFSINHCSKIN